MTMNETDGKFSIKNGVISGKLCEADQSGKTYKDRLIIQSRFTCDTVKKEFCEVNTKGVVVNKAKFEPMFQVDDQLVNPTKRYEFVIMRN